jgi:hypothetical protein
MGVILACDGMLAKPRRLSSRPKAPVFLDVRLALP